mgnify:CR=1 FL=1|jgi:hypothetical protein
MIEVFNAPQSLQIKIQQAASKLCQSRHSRRFYPFSGCCLFTRPTQYQTNKLTHTHWQIAVCANLVIT